MTRVNIAGREFGSTGAKTDPGDAKTRLGHIDEIVPYQNENFWKNQFAGMLAHYEVYGIAVWDIATPYVLNSYTLGSDGIIYRSLQAGNTGNNPLSSPSWWTKAFVDLSTNETIAGTKTFNALKLGGNQDANNKKIVNLATPASNQDAANKAYADASPAAQMSPSSYAGEQSVTLPNGMILKLGQWTGTLANGTTTTITFGTAFPISAIIGLANENNISNAAGVASGYGTSVTTTGITLFNKDDGGSKYNAYWFAIGY